MNCLLRRMGFIGLWLVFASCSVIAEQPTHQPAKVAPSALSALKTLAANKARNGLYASAAVANDGRQEYTVWNLEFRDAAACRAFDVPGITVIAKFERFADIFMPADEGVFDKVQSAAGLVWMDWSTGALLPPPARPVPSKEKPRQIPDKIVQGGIDGLTGAGVIVAIVDTGIDFRHEDFIRYDAEGRAVSRVLYYWDTTSDLYANGVGQPAHVKYPNGAALGTIYTRDVLTADLGTPQNEIQIWDAHGHGTACAGIAAGNGNASNKKYLGVAPQADIVAVRVSSGSGERGIDNAYLIGAICDWLEDVAKDRPLVVSCSYGGHRGGHDGESVEERQINARFALGREGRSICIAAGNEGAEPIHAGFVVGKQSEATNIAWNDPEGDGVVLSLFVQTDKTSDLSLAPLGNTRLAVNNDFVHGLTNQAVVEIVASGGPGGVLIYSNSGGRYPADAYIVSGNFTREATRFEKLIGTPGGAANAITVGSYDWNDRFHLRGQVVEVPDFQRQAPLRIGALSTYSSPGPSRLGQVKPDIVAPGQWYTAPLPSNKPTNFPESSGHYAIFNGTSAATPYTAGLIALLFEKKPSLTVGQVKELLKNCATSDPLTGDVPNSRWGYGKLDMAAVRRMLDQID